MSREIGFSAGLPADNSAPLLPSERSEGVSLFPPGQGAPPSPRALGASYDPELAERWARIRSRQLASKGYSWALLPCGGFIDEARSDLEMLRACARGVRAAGLLPVLDRRGRQPEAKHGSDALLATEIRHVLLDDDEMRGRFERLHDLELVTLVIGEGGAGSASEALALVDRPRAVTSQLLEQARAARSEVAERSFVLLADSDYSFDRAAASKDVDDDRGPQVFIGVDASSALPRADAASCVLVSHDEGPAARAAAARILRGESFVRGRLPHDLTGYARGSGISARRARDGSASELERAPAAQGCFDAKFASTLSSYVRGAIGARIFPACQIAITLRGQLVLSRAFGRETYARGDPEVREGHVFDLASVTKVVASTALAMRFYEDGKLRLDAPARELVPALAKAAKGRSPAITLEHLLSHSSGMAPWKRLWNFASTPSGVLRVACQEPLRFRPGSSYAYSDLGMIVFGKCLEGIGEAPLDVLTTRFVCEALGMRRTRFGPVQPGQGVVPTEDEPGRGGVIRGRVHDENAEALGGVAGHAGLFSNAWDLARFTNAIAAGGLGVWKRRTIDRFCQRSTDVIESSRALGFDTPTKSNSAGRCISASSVGHTGFTGTSIWIDRTRELTVVCLTNRIHPSRNEGRIHSFRRNLHDLVVMSLRCDPAPRQRW